MDEEDYNIVPDDKIKMRKNCSCTQESMNRHKKPRYVCNGTCNTGKTFMVIARQNVLRLTNVRTFCIFNI